MAKKVTEPTHYEKDHTTLAVDPASVREGDQLIISGTAWGDCPVRIEMDGKIVKPFRVAQGYLVSENVQPDAMGNFVAFIATLGIRSGKYELIVSSTNKKQETSVTRTIEVFERPPLELGEGDEEVAYWRTLDFFNRRFGHIGFIPPGTRGTQISQLRCLREKRDRINQRARLRQMFSEELEPSMPNPVACNWNPAGSGPVVVGQGLAFAGRTLSIAIDPTTPDTIYIGTANAGIWKSTDNGSTWAPKSDYAISMAIGALAIDPHNSLRIFAGTGEYNDVGVGTYYGNGILRSVDGGNTWTELATSIFQRVEISRIVFDPTDATSQHMVLSCSNGVYESIDGGVNWTQLRAGSASSLVLIVSTGPPVAVKLIAAFYGSGLWTSTKSGSTWSTWTQVTGAAFPTSFGRIALGQSQNNPQNIYVAFSYQSSLAGIAKTIDGGTTWSSVGAPPSLSSQTWYNFHISVHTNDPNTVYYGEVALWKTTTGNAPWTSTPIPHSDQHAFAFDPTNPNIIWACNDGGVYRSLDAGTTWVHRNRDLATLQYISLSLHPQWDAVMLGGTQDNGTHRYSGNPAWEFSAGGDGGFTAINPSTPTRMYHEYIYNTFYRSDNAGATGSWVLKTGAITGPAEFYSPFTLDPSMPDICYFGGNQLWRSPDNADTWSAITNPLAGNITSIAVHPTDSTTIYVGTTQGHVYKVQKTSATWALTDVTTTDLTGPNLPMNVYLSAIAVDTAGTVWGTIASVLWSESTGEFNNNHVYRRIPGATTWETRSTGLVQANPINTIVIDPTNNNRLFCGGDVSVFRTDDAGTAWIVWDEGLPNTPVFDLAIHSPRRLLRAATHGRSVWERPIDTTVCPLVDLYMRDDIVDTGRVQPTQAYQTDPFIPGTLISWWESVDIKVDAPQPNFQTTSPVTDYVAFESDIQHRNPSRNRTNRFYVQVHNRGVNKATNIQVRAFFADASAGLPSLPSDFWSAGKPFSADPSGTTWTPVGPTQTIVELDPAEPGIVEWDWFVPAAATHSCLLAMATCTEDPLNGSGVFDVATLVTSRKQVTLKNLHVDDPVPGMPLPAQDAYLLELHNINHEDTSFDIVFHWENLPDETSIYVVFEILPDTKPGIPGEPAVLEQAGIKAVHPKEKLFQEKIEDRCGEISHLDIQHIYRLSPKEDRMTVIPGIHIPYNRSRILAINLILPKHRKYKTVQFSVIQQSGKRVTGGSTYLLHPQKS
jgi:photosystem II stability/assembly factor-like uncharacterized protein